MYVAIKQNTYKDIETQKTFFKWCKMKTLEYKVCLELE